MACYTLAISQTYILHAGGFTIDSIVPARCDDDDVGSLRLRGVLLDFQLVAGSGNATSRSRNCIVLG